MDLIEVHGKRLVFNIEANNDIDLISKGRHDRYVINKKLFNKKVERIKAGV